MDGWSRLPNGAAPRIAAPIWSIRGCPAKARSSTAASPISPKPGRRMPHQAARDHGQRRGQPPLHHQWPIHRAVPALFARLQQIAYLSYIDGNPRIYVYDIDSGRQTLVTESSNPTFAPRWSPDGHYILYSMAMAGNTDIYRVPASGGGTSAAADQHARGSTSADHTRPMAARSCSKATVRANSRSMS